MMPVTMIPTLLYNLFFLLLITEVAFGCPTWYYESNNTGGCICGSELGGGLICHQYTQTVEISADFCMTYDDHTQEVFAGDCAYGYSSNMSNRRYSIVESNYTSLNSSQCASYNRKGLFCGECRDGFGPAVYSFDLKCANCSTMPTALAIAAYCLLEFVPITIFFFIVVIFHLQIMSGPLIGYVIFCQSMIITLQYSRYLYPSIFAKLSSPIAVLGHAGLVLCGIWNLDFFRFIIPSFCISERLTNLHLQMLGFCTAFYPLFLVIVSYLAIEMRARYNLIRKCVCKLNSTRNVSHSIIHTFATFTILSVFSVMCQGYAVLQASRVLDVHGNVRKTVVFCESTIVLFSYEHLPYVFATLFTAFILVVCPGLLLCVYPTRVYAKLSRCISVRKQIAVKIFVESIHSGFKDGLNGTRDYRMIPGVIILLALVFSLLVPTLPQYGFGGFSPITTGLIFSFVSYIVSFLRPCKSLVMSMSISFHLLLMGVMSLSIALWWQDLMLDSEILASTIALLSVIPHALMVLWVGHKIVQGYNGYPRGAQVVLKMLKSMYQTCRCKTNRDDYSQLHQIPDAAEQQPLL